MKYFIFLLIAILSYSVIAATTHNIYNAQGYLIAECQTEGEKTCQYLIYKGLSNVGKVKDQILQRYFHGPTGKIAALDKAESQITFLVPDFHSSIPVMVQKEFIEQYLLDAFGNELRDKKAIYTDKHPIEGAKFRNFNARFYDAELGRFTTTDPIEHMNWYSYANNNPLSFTDPTGKCPQCAVAGEAAVITYDAAISLYFSYKAYQLYTNRASDQSIYSAEEKKPQHHPVTKDAMRNSGNVDAYENRYDPSIFAAALVERAGFKNFVKASSDSREMMGKIYGILYGAEGVTLEERVEMFKEMARIITDKVTPFGWVAYPEKSTDPNIYIFAGPQKLGAKAPVIVFRENAYGEFEIWRDSPYFRDKALVPEVDRLGNPTGRYTPDFNNMDKR